MMRYAIPLFAVALLVSGCVDQRAARQAALQRFVGQPEAALIQQMGVPTRHYETGGAKYLAYDEKRVEIVPAFPAYGYGAPFWGWYGGGFPPEVVSYTCETTFVIASGVVQSFSQRGNTCG